MGTCEKGKCTSPVPPTNLMLPRWAPPLVLLQEQYAGIAKAISQFEPLKMIASPGAVSCRRAWNLSPLSNV